MVQLSNIYWWEERPALLLHVNLGLLLLWVAVSQAVGHPVVEDDLNLACVEEQLGLVGWVSQWKGWLAVQFSHKKYAYISYLDCSDICVSWWCLSWAVLAWSIKAHTRVIRLKWHSWNWMELELTFLHFRSPTRGCTSSPSRRRCGRPSPRCRRRRAWRRRQRRNPRHSCRSRCWTCLLSAMLKGKILLVILDTFSTVQVLEGFFFTCHSSACSSSSFQFRLSIGTISSSRSSSVNH